MTNYFEEPKRPKSHQIGDLAKEQISELFATKGWVINPIVSDYGDDLHIQLTEGSTLIPIRFYIQIKGTKNIKKFQTKSTYNISKIKRSSVAHWLNSIEPVVLVLWNTTKKSGVYGLASDIFENYNSKKKTKFFTASLSKNSLFNKQSLERFRADIIEHYCNKRYMNLAGMQSLVEKNRKIAEFYGVQKNNIKLDMAETVLLYLTSMKILKIDHKNQTFRLDNKFHKTFFLEFAKYFRKTNFDRGYAGKKFEKEFDKVLILSLTKWTAEKFDQGIHAAMLDASTQVMRMIFKSAITKTKNLLR